MLSGHGWQRPVGRPNAYKQWTAFAETLSAARGARTERAADARLELPTRNFHMWAVHAVEERGQLASGSG